MTPTLDEFKALLTKHADVLRKHKLLDEHGVTGYWMKSGTKRRDYRKRDDIVKLPEPDHENL